MTVAMSTARDQLADIAPWSTRPSERRTVATWYRTEDGAVRVVVTRWCRATATDQRAATVGSLRDAWRLVVAAGAVHRDKARDRYAFTAWCQLARR